MLAPAFFGWRWSSGRGYDDGFRCCSEMQLDRHGVGVSGDIFGLRGEAGSQHFYLVIAGGQSAAL